MNPLAERRERQRQVLCTLLFSDYAYRDLPEDFTPDCFEGEDHRKLFEVFKSEFIETGQPANSVLLGQKFSPFIPAIMDVSNPVSMLNGRLRQVASTLKNHRTLEKIDTPEEAQPEIKIDTEQPQTSLPSLTEYLVRVEAFLRRYICFASEHQSVAVALWIAHSWIVDRFEVSPILAATSAEMRSGKTRVLDCVELVVPNPLRLILPSEAVTFTLLSQRPRRTMLLDEADAIWSGRNSSERTEGLRAILNSGNAQGTPVPRVKLDKGKREVEWFDCFGAKVVAGIGRLPSTVADRSIRIIMRRRSPNEPIAKFRRRIAKAETQELYFDFQNVTLETEPSVPDELNDRAADSWEPLLAIADYAGADWPGRARRAAVALSAEEDNPSLGMKLLLDVQQVFGDDAHIETRVLLERLHELEDCPWSEFYGKPLTGRGLAKLLEPYGVHPALHRIGVKPIRGYFKDDFLDAWKRYTPPPASVTSVTSDTCDIEFPLVTDVTDVTVPTEGIELEDDEAERDMRLSLQNGN